MIRKKISNNSATLKFFNKKLELANFLNEHRDNYNTQYGIKSSSLFQVKNDFPKLTTSIIPQGIYNTSYYIENSAIEKFKVDFDKTINETKYE